MSNLFIVSEAFKTVPLIMTHGRSVKMITFWVCDYSCYINSCQISHLKAREAEGRGQLGGFLPHILVIIRDHDPHFFVSAMNLAMR